MQISFAVTTKMISAFVFAIRIVQSLYFLDPKFKPLVIFCDCAAWFVSDLVGNPEDRFSHKEAHLKAYEPRRKNARLHGFRPGQTQNSLFANNCLKLSEIETKLSRKHCFKAGVSMVRLTNYWPYDHIF